MNAPSKSASHYPSVLITGLGFAGAVGDGVSSLAHRLEQGESSIRQLAPEQQPISSITWGALLETEWNWRNTEGARSLSVAERGRMEKLFRGAGTALLADAAAVLEARAQGRLQEHPIAPERLALVVGGTNLSHPVLFDEMQRFARNPAFVNPRISYQILDTHTAASLAALVNARGPVLNVGAAAASGAVAVVTALDMLRLGRCDACLVLGAMQQLSPIDWQALVTMGAVNTTPESPFDGNGLIPGEAAACVLLERVDSIRHRDLNGLAELAGGACVSAADPLPWPSGPEETRAMAMALADANASIADVDLITAHATGTAKGDAAEAGAIAELLGEDLERVWVTVPKAITGHCLSAAGVVGLVATVLMISSGRIYPLPHHCPAFSASLRIAAGNAVATPIRYAISNAFGFGGMNAALVVRANPERKS